jgi:uncharacterized protein YndB with AHSA1/START domain
MIGLVAVVLALVLFIVVARKTTSVVNVERTLNAPVAKVWALWNDPEAIKNWWSPKGYTAPVVKNDLRVGGTYLLSMKSPSGEMHWNAGTYKEIIPQSRIVSAMTFSDENGKMVPGAEVKVPGSWPDEITLIVEFKEAGGKTLVTIQEIGIPLIMKVFAKMGWEQQFDKFEKLL